MVDSNMRIVSLLPGTTEIIARLGLEEQLVGRSHECDFPASVQSLPACTEPKFNPDGQSYEIDQRVKALLQEGLSVYRVDAEKLKELRPDVIITQDHCEVCAVSVDTVKEAVEEYLQSPVEVISVSPTTLNQVYESISSIAEVLNAGEAGERLIRNMQQDLETLAARCSPLPRKTIACIEWLEPLMTAGNWVPALADIAGLEVTGAEAGKHSPYVQWESIRETDPDLICVMPCGYGIAKTLEEMSSLTNQPGWKRLKAVSEKQVFITDGHHYFNRPGPRLVDSARILAEIAHPDIEPTLKEKGWINYAEIIQ